MCMYIYLTNGNTLIDSILLVITAFKIYLFQEKIITFIEIEEDLSKWTMIKDKKDIIKM